jgi:hypothetical protein
MNKPKIIDLSSKNSNETEKDDKPKKKEYDLNDKRLMSINLDKNVKVTLLENEKGQFVDFRKYYNDFPTKKGIRIDAHVFKKVTDELKDELNNLK